MGNTIKNPVPTAIGDRVSKLVKVRSSNNQDTTPNTNARQRLVLNAAVYALELNLPYGGVWS